MAREIDIVINNDGTVELDQIGYKGKECIQDVEGLLNVLGTKVKGTKKREYFEKAKVKINQQT